MYELILREIAVIDEALSIVCDRMNPADRISDALLREVLDCMENIRKAVDECTDCRPSPMKSSALSAP